MMNVQYKWSDVNCSVHLATCKVFCTGRGGEGHSMVVNVEGVMWCPVLADVVSCTS